MKRLGVLLWLVACGSPKTPEATPEAPPVKENPAPEAPKPEPPPPPAAPSLPADANPTLLNPELATEKAPKQFKVKFETTKGAFTIEVHRDWAPNGADRFYNLVKIGYFQDIAFFRAIDGFMVQFGISGYPQLNEVWRPARIPDDVPKESNQRGKLTFATSGPDSRTVQLFINYGDNAMLDGQGFAPIGQVTEGMEVVDSLYKGYGEGAPRGRGPSQQNLQEEGNTYLREKFPNLDYIQKATVLP